jgi:hypothetical protein
MTCTILLYKKQSCYFEAFLRFVVLAGMSIVISLGIKSYYETFLYDEGCVDVMFGSESVWATGLRQHLLNEL